MTNQADRFLTKRQAASQLAIAVSTLDSWAKKKDFPKPVKLGQRVRYLESEIGAWIAKTAESSRAAIAKVTGGVA